MPTDPSLGRDKESPARVLETNVASLAIATRNAITNQLGQGTPLENLRKVPELMNGNSPDQAASCLESLSSLDQLQKLLSQTDKLAPMLPAIRSCCSEVS